MDWGPDQNIWRQSSGTSWDAGGNNDDGFTIDIDFEAIFEAQRAHSEENTTCRSDARFAGLNRRAMGKLIRNRIATTMDRSELRRALDTLTELGKRRDRNETGLLAFPKARAAIHRRLAEIT